MAGRIRQNDVDEVKSRTNLGDIVGERVSLKSAGVGSLKGLCPFHDERTPSFQVRPNVGYYHCFGCGESGDVITFIQRMDHLSFAETVERLAARIGYPLHYEDGAEAPQGSGRARLYAANAAAEEFFRAELISAEAATARQFLGSRGFDTGAAAHFGVGYAPQGWERMTQALQARGFTGEELLAAGLVSQGRRGVYDRFRGRLVWPIRDVSSQIVGFGARKLFDDDQGPKYLNTPETPIYHKAQVLYGLDLAKRDISRTQRAVIVEGYTDVMACHLAGVTTAVATSGTSFGSDHIAVLRRVLGDHSGVGDVIFTFDPDAAGTKAALRAFSEERRFAAQTYVAVAPDGLDPSDLRVQRGDGAVRALIENKVPMFEFVIDQRLAEFDLNTVEGRAGALTATAPIVAQIRDPSLQPGYIRVLARRIGLELAEVSQAVRRTRSHSSGAATHGNEIRPASAADGSAAGAVPAVTLTSLPRTAAIALERDALMGVLQYGHRLDAELVRRSLTDEFSHPALDTIRRAVLAAPDWEQPGWSVRAVEAVREPFRSVAAELLTGNYPARTEEDAIASATGTARSLIVRSLQRQKTELLRTIQRVSPESDEGRTVRMRLRELDAERQQLVSE